MGMKMRMMRVHCGGGGGVVNHVGVTGRAFGASASVLISLRLSSHEFCVHTVAAVIRVTMVPMTPWKPSLLQVLKASSPADCDLEELQVHDVSRSDSEPQLRASALYSLPTYTARRGAEHKFLGETATTDDLMPMQGSWTPSGTKPRAVTEPRS